MIACGCGRVRRGGGARHGPARMAWATRSPLLAAALPVRSQAATLSPEARHVEDPRRAPARRRDAGIPGNVGTRDCPAVGTCDLNSLRFAVAARHLGSVERPLPSPYS